MIGPSAINYVVLALVPFCSTSTVLHAWTEVDSRILVADVSLAHLSPPGNHAAQHEPPCLSELVDAVAGCRVCRDTPIRRALPHEPRPIHQISPTAKIVIASQAPGLRAHVSGVPFQDPSGQRLREWLALDEKAFYDSTRLAIVPMGFCFPGYDANKGDLPPRPECRLTWHEAVFAAMPQVELIFAIGTYAMRYHMARLGYAVNTKASMAELVLEQGEMWSAGKARLLPLPHPSWRNTAWLNRNPRFEAEILPRVRQLVRELM